MLLFHGSSGFPHTASHIYFWRSMPSAPSLLIGGTPFNGWRPAHLKAFLIKCVCEFLHWLLFASSPNSSLCRLQYFVIMPVDVLSIEAMSASDNQAKNFSSMLGWYNNDPPATAESLHLGLGFPYLLACPCSPSIS